MYYVYKLLYGGILPLERWLMQRRNLVVDETLLEKVRTGLGFRTYSEAVNASLEEMLRIHELKKAFYERGEEILEGRLKQEQREKKGRKKKE